MIEIKDKSGNVRFTTPINQGSKRKLQLMKEDYITLKFSVEKPIYFSLGHNIDNEIGMFELVDLCKPTFNRETGGYDYELRLDAYYWKWKNKKFFYISEPGRKESSWSLTATLDMHMKVFLNNLQQLGYTFRDQAFSYTADTTLDGSAKLISYDSTNLIDALSQMAEAWECEWWITDSVINFGRCEFSDPVDFEIDTNVAEMTCSDSQSTYATRIYAFGSTKNLPTDYRSANPDAVVNGVVQKRLMLPSDTPFIDAFPGMNVEEAIEEVVVFEDVYPHRIGTISSITPYAYTEKIEEEGKAPVFKKWNAYRFKDSGLTFSQKYVLPGQELKIAFQSGAMNGMSFTVSFNPCDKDKNEKPQPEKTSDGAWNPLAQVFEIVRNEDYGRPIPDESLKPSVGDKYVLYGFDTKFVSETMLPEAEKELLERAKKYVEKSKTDPSTYTCKMMSDWVFDDPARRVFTVGDRVNLINKTYFDKGRQSRIIGYEYCLDIPYDNPVYTVGETAAYSRLGAIETKVDSLTFNGQSYTGTGTTGSGASVYVIGINDRTLPSDRNVFSSKKALNTFLNKTEPDTALGHIIFENGILVRKQEIIEASPMSLMEEGDAIVEELAMKEDITTLGSIENVSAAADEPSDTCDVLVRLAGAAEWVVDSALYTNVSRLMGEVFPFTMSLSGGGVYEIGSIQTVNLSWSYDREVIEQSINNQLLPNHIRTQQFTGVNADTTYILSVVYGDKTYTKTVSAEFRRKKYYGVSEHENIANEEILSLSKSWAGRALAVSAFDCRGGKYPYYILPTSMVEGIQFWMGGLRNTDWTEEVRNITNAYGHTESYTIFRLNNIQTGVLNIEVR